MHLHFLSLAPEQLLHLCALQPQMASSFIQPCRKLAPWEAVLATPHPQGHSSIQLFNIASSYDLELLTSACWTPSHLSDPD